MLFHQSFGTPTNAPSLLFLHGFLGSGLDFAPLIESLQKEYHCISIDLPAHGSSGYVPDLFSSLEETIHSLPISSPLLIGYSLGGRLALSYAHKHRAKVQGVIAISSHFGLKDPLEKKERLTQELLWQERLLTLPPEAFLSLWYKQSIFSSLQENKELLQELLQKRLYKNPEELCSIFAKASLSKQPYFLPCNHPVLFLFGNQDLKYKTLYEVLKPGEKLEILSAGHTAHLENPKGCIEAIRSFLQNTTIRST
jgi:2-succinyl-6-hydroxy-2,4-cyclohexadiene-1-carboxylate synthase